VSGAPALLALFLFAQVGGLPGLGDGAGPVNVRADLLARDGESGVIRYEGGVVLTSGGLVLRSDALTFDPATQVAEARGKVTLVAGDFVAIAEGLTLEVPAQRVLVTDGLVLQKKGASPEALAQAKTAAELLAIGQNELSMRGARIERLGPGRFRVEDLSLTPCDCDPKNPSWRIRAKSAEVVAGESASLYGWQVFVDQVPVLLPGVPLPYLQVPLSNRRSGLLFPLIDFGGINGPGLDLPLFWAPHPSFDFTFTPGYSLGNEGVPEDLDTPDVRERQYNPTGIAGPRLTTEFRYAPTQGTAGSTTLGLLYDLRRPRNPLNLGDPTGQDIPFGGEGPDLPGRRGLRGELTLAHRQELAPGTELRADLALVSDGFYLKDFAKGVFQLAIPYTRSTLSLARVTPDSYLGVDAILRQDLSVGVPLFDLFARTRELPTQQLPDGRGNLGELWGRVVGQNTFHRLPGFTYALQDRPLVGPITWGLELDAARSAALNGAEWVDLAYDGQTFAVTPREDRRERRDRLDVLPYLRASLPLGDAVTLSPSLAWRQTAVFGEQTGAAGTRGYPLLRLNAQSQLARRFGAPGAAGLRHVITPRVEARWVPRVFGGLPVGATLSRVYDARDLPLSVSRIPGGQTRFGQPDCLLQSIAEVSQRLMTVDAQGRSAELVRLDVGQGVDLRPDGPEAGCADAGAPRPADTYARLGGRYGPLSLGGFVRYTPAVRAVTQNSFNASWSFGAAGNVTASYDDIPPIGSDRLFRGLDSLLGVIPEPDLTQLPSALQLDPSSPSGFSIKRFPVASGSGAWATPIRGLTLSGGTTFQYKPPFPEEVAEGTDAAQEPFAWRFLSAGAGVRYAPACNCWSVDVGATVSAPNFRFTFGGINLTITNFGQLGI
jgi:LPS-assembly protein